MTEEPAQPSPFKDAPPLGFQRGRRGSLPGGPGIEEAAQPSPFKDGPPLGFQRGRRASLPGGPGMSALTAALLPGRSPHPESRSRSNSQHAAAAAAAHAHYADLTDDDDVSDDSSEDPFAGEDEVNASCYRLSRRSTYIFMFPRKNHAPTLGAKVFEIFIMFLIVANVIIVIISSDCNQDSCMETFFSFRIVSAVIFTVEYVLRLWSCVEEHAGKSHSFWTRLRYACSFLGLVDLCSIIPYFLDVTGDHKFRGASGIQMLRLLRIVALMKLERQWASFQRLAQVFNHQKNELLATGFITAISLLMVSAVMYFVENSGGGEPVKGFENIPATLWWGCTALTSVGYNNTPSPQSTAGKAIAGIVAFAGVGLCGLLAGILGSGFIEVMCEETEREQRRSARLDAQLAKEYEAEALQEQEELQAGMPKRLSIVRGPSSQKLLGSSPNLTNTSSPSIGTIPEGGGGAASTVAPAVSSTFPKLEVYGNGNGSGVQISQGSGSGTGLGAGDMGDTSMHHSWTVHEENQALRERVAHLEAQLATIQQLCNTGTGAGQ